MRPRDIRQLLQDIQEAILDVQTFTGDLPLEQYRDSKITRMAVERQLITIGEAFARMRFLSEIAKNRVDNAVKISGFRNFLVHEYEAIDDEQVWTVVQVSVPKLKQQIDAWAAELGMEASLGTSLIVPVGTKKHL